MAAMGEFSVSRAIRNAIAILRQNQRTVLISLGAFSLLPSAFFGLIGYFRPPDPDNFMSAIRGAPGEGLLTFVLNVLASSIIIYSGVKSLNGEDETFEGSLARVRAIMAPLIGLALLTGLGIVIGFIFLIIPGLFLLTVWSAAQPVRVMERIGVMEAIGRSFRLTQGCRWNVFAVIMALVGVVIAAFIVAAIITLITDRITPLFDALVVTPVLEAAITGAAAAVSAAIYHELLAAKEGGGSATADLFS